MEGEKVEPGVIFIGKEKKMKKPRNIFKKAFSILVLMGSVFALVMAWFVFSDLPTLEKLKNYQPPQSTSVFDRNGKVIGRFFDERRTVIDIRALPPFVAQAFVAAEDADFYEHKGIDYLGLLRAVLLEIKYRTVGGRRVGGSTITQQTARTMLLTSKQTYVRKLREMILAKRIEDALSKDQILHLYLNQIYFGNGAYGIEEAALTYFQKSAQDLQLFEAAALASIPKSPNRINPFGDTKRLSIRQHYVLQQMLKRGFINEAQEKDARSAPLFSAVSDKTIDQRAPYFLRMVKLELLPSLGEDYVRQGGLKVFSTLDIDLQASAKKSLREGLERIDKRNGYRGPIFRGDPEQRKKLKEKLGEFKRKVFAKKFKDKIWNLRGINGAKIDHDLNSSIDNLPLVAVKDKIKIAGLVQKVSDRLNQIHVDLGSMSLALDLKENQWAQKSTKGNSTANKKKVSQIFKPDDIILIELEVSPNAIRAKLAQEPEINGGFVALDLKSGDILALVGGYDFERSPFNRVIQAKRQPGSGIKPLIYSLAIEKNLANAATLITDSPRAFFDPGTNQFWRPRNHTRKFLGDITFRTCLRSSINICTISLLEKIGIKSFHEFAESVGLISETTPYPNNLTIALGSAENYPIQVASAMRVLGNQGYFSKPNIIRGLKYFDQQEEKLDRFEEKKVLSAESAFIVSHILKSAISAPLKNRYLPNVACDIAGKTGTTNNTRSAWFFGYTPEILALVYVGYDDNRSIGKNEWGITTAFPIWAQFMNGIPSHGNENLSFDVPENIEWRYVDRASGRGRQAPEEEEDLAELNLVNEPFVMGTAPAIEEPGKIVRAPIKLLDDAAFAP